MTPLDSSTLTQELQGSGGRRIRPPLHPDSPGWRREDLGGSPEHQPGPEGTTRPQHQPPTGSMLIAPERPCRGLPESVDERLRSVRNCGRGTIVTFDAPACRVYAFPARCKSWSCPKCRPYLINSRAERIANAKPARFITLTCDPKLHATPAHACNAMNRAFPKLVAALRKAGLEVEYAAVWEITKAGWPHLHVAQKGDYIPHAMLKKLWQRLRIGSIVDLRAIYSHKGCARYIAKYMTKTGQAQPAASWPRRSFRASRHFFDREPLQAGLTLRPHHHVAYVRETVHWCATHLWSTAAISLVEVRPSGRCEFVLHPAMCNDYAIVEYLAGIT